MLHNRSLIDFIILLNMHDDPFAIKKEVRLVLRTIKSSIMVVMTTILQQT